MSSSMSCLNGDRPIWFDDWRFLKLQKMEALAYSRLKRKKNAMIKWFKLVITRDLVLTVWNFSYWRLTDGYTSKNCSRQCGGRSTNLREEFREDWEILMKTTATIFFNRNRTSFLKSLRKTESTLNPKIMLHFHPSVSTSFPVWKHKNTQLLNRIGIVPSRVPAKFWIPIPEPVYIYKTTTPKTV